MVTEARLLQFSKAASPILVTLLPMVMEVRPAQFIKVPPPLILVKLLGMVTEVRP